MKKPLKLLCSIMAISLFSASIATPISVNATSPGVHPTIKTEFERSRQAAATYIQDFFNEINRIGLNSRTRFLVSQSMQFFLRNSPPINSNFWDQPLPSDSEILESFQRVNCEQHETSAPKLSATALAGTIV